ncbi:KAP family P-loop NTPase fold protein [Marinobacterium sedimentorum]|uniref:KAP family P-loop NTPase fold protein n=1 Tax=Marinobacterium sedimentorum TaxID=2927804 RepID=UPI0020C6828A|nr:P-loop NTPase fold protein [Marinobacterium sedimentorum]MCP8686620.1 KAP family NTPase [Marinobacterium sedimentorum]
MNILNLKLKQFQFDPNDPFKFDLLGRKEEILNLSLLASNVNSPAVIAIDSRWGTGKTTFIKLWEQYLKAENKPRLYFNAWETDFSDDPLVSFLGEMNEGLKNLIGSSDKANEAWEKTKAAGRQVAKRGIPALIRVATAGIIDADKIIEEEAVKAAGSLAGDALDNYLQQKEAIYEFHNALANFIENSANGRQLVIFVDELDRCRPNYAIELLERIKHLFNIEGLIFVLALDKEQLGHSIAAVYGNGIDSTGYLRRFIDFEYQLKKPDISNYIESLISSLDLEEFFNPRVKYRELQCDQEYLKKVFIMLALGLQLSLREIEQFLASINIAIRTAKENEYIFPALLVFLIISKHFKPDAYQRYISDDGDEKELIDYLYKIVPEKNRNDSFECALVEGFLIAAKKSRFSKGESAIFLRHREILQDAELDNKGKQYSDTVINIVNRPAGTGHGVNLKQLKDRIEWLSRFDFLDIQD